MNVDQRLDSTIQKALEVKKFCVKFHDERNNWPTIREIREGAHISSTSVVRYYLDILTDEGYLLPRPLNFPRFMQWTDKE